MVLTVGKGGHKLKPVETDEPPNFKTGKLNLTGKGATMAQLIAFLSRELRNPIVDQTGLTGRFDYFLDIAPYFTEEMQRSGGPGGGPPPDAPGIVAQAMQAQLGLKVEALAVEAPLTHHHAFGGGEWIPTKPAESGVRAKPGPRDEANVQRLRGCPDDPQVGVPPVQVEAGFLMGDAEFHGTIVRLVVAVEPSIDGCAHTQCLCELPSTP